MTDKQKQAILLLNKLQQQCSISDNEYFLLLDFIVEANVPTFQFPTKIWNDEIKKLDDTPITVMYGCPTPFTLSDNITSTENSNKK